MRHADKSEKSKSWRVAAVQRAANNNGPKVVYDLRFPGQCYQAETGLNNNHFKAEF